MMKLNNSADHTSPCFTIDKFDAPQHHSMTVKSVLLLMVLTITSTVGCGGSSQEIPHGKVTGVVLFEDYPISEGTITFYSTETGNAVPAALGSDGSFSLSDGIEIGSYSIMITPPSSENSDGMTPEQTPKKSYANIPTSYRSSETSKLQAEVKLGENHFVFKMK